MAGSVCNTWRVAWELPTPRRPYDVSLHILQEHNTQEQDIEQINCPLLLPGTGDLLNWKTWGSDLRIEPQEPDFSKMFSNLTRNRCDLERQDATSSTVQNTAYWMFYARRYNEIQTRQYNQVMQHGDCPQQKQLRTSLLLECLIGCSASRRAELGNIYAAFNNSSEIVKINNAILCSHA
jgi:hypothetical protein